MRDFSLGAHIGQQNMTADEMRALWRRCDEAGLDWLSAWDHLYEAPPEGGTVPHLEALATLGAMAVETTNVRIGSLVFYVGYRNPALLAKAATTIDHLSGGRFELGLGAGWHQWEAAAHGYDFPSLGTRLDMLDEATQIIRGMLTQDRTTFEGKHFRVDNCSCLPPPVNGHLPIWIGGVGEKRALRLAAKYADGWNAAYVPPEEFERLGSVLDNWCETENRDPSDIERSINLTFNLAMDDAGAKRQEARMREQWGDMFAGVQAGALLGTPDEAVDRILAYRDAGADGLNVALRAPFEAEAFEAFLTEVVPAVRARLAT